jgi:hypothetical protein
VRANGQPRETLLEASRLLGARFGGARVLGGHLTEGDHIIVDTDGETFDVSLGVEQERHERRGCPRGLDLDLVQGARVEAAEPPRGLPGELALGRGLGLDAVAIPVVGPRGDDDAVGPAVVQSTRDVDFSHGLPVLLHELARSARQAGRLTALPAAASVPTDSRNPLRPSPLKHSDPGRTFVLSRFGLVAQERREP